jgi:hypothetical protein
MAQVDSENSTSMPVDPTRRRFLTVAAGATTLTVAPARAAPAVDPIYAAIERHKAACVPWDAAIDVRAEFSGIRLRLSGSNYPQPPRMGGCARCAARFGEWPRLRRIIGERD